MNAILWISERVCKVLVYSSDGKVIDIDDSWNNIASTQSWLYDAYPEAKQTVVRDQKQIRDLDREFSACRNGN